MGEALRRDRVPSRRALLDILVRLGDSIIPARVELAR